MIDWETEFFEVTWPGGVNDGSSFAIDCSAIPDLNLAVEQSGYVNLGEALFRRLVTFRGGLFYDVDYGFDVRQWINDHGTEDRIYELATGVAVECEKDPRVESAEVDVLQLDQRRGQIRIVCRIAAGLATYTLAWGGTPEAALRMQWEGSDAEPIYRPAGRLIG